MEVKQKPFFVTMRAFTNETFNYQVNFLTAIKFTWINVTASLHCLESFLSLVGQVDKHA